jgi:hypothetical protein
MRGEREVFRERRAVGEEVATRDLDPRFLGNDVLKTTKFELSHTENAGYAEKKPVFEEQHQEKYPLCAL